MRVILCLLYFGVSFLVSGQNKNAEKQLKQDVATIDKYLKKNSISAIKDESGLRYSVTTEGDGSEKPSINSTVTVRYVGMFLESAKIFDESATPITLPLNGVVKGWQIGLSKLSKGGAITLYVPSGLAYGANGVEGAIPPYSNLVFVVELIDFNL